MMKTFNKILGVMFLLLASTSQAMQFGQPFIVHFFDYQYQAHDQNLCVKKAPSSVLFFCNGRGILRYDGTNWELLESVLFTSVYDFEFRAETGRIYTGANNHLGFFSINVNNEWNFIELNDPNRPNFSHIARVAKSSLGIFFLSENHIFFFDDGEIKEQPLIDDQGSRGSDFYIQGANNQNINDQGINKPLSNKLGTHKKEAKLSWFPVEQGLTYHASVINDQLHVFDAKHGVRKLNMVTGKLETVDGSILVKKYVMFDIDLGNGNWLLGTAGNGLFMYDGHTASEFYPELYQEHGQLLNGVLLPKGDFALASRSKGLFIVNQQGELLRHFNELSGLESNQVIGLEYDEQGGLWLAYSGGISQIIQPTALSIVDKKSGLNHVESVLPWQDKTYVGTRNELLEFGMSKERLVTKQLIDVDIFVNDIDQLNDSLLVSTGRSIKHYSRVDNESLSNNGKILVESQLPVYSQTLVSNVIENTAYSSLGNRLYRIEQRDGQWKVNQKSYELDESIAKILELPSGELWLGSETQSVAHLKNTSDWDKVKILQYGEKDNLPSRYVFPHVIQDNVVFSSPKGFYKFNSVSKQFVEDNQYLGSQNSEYGAFRLAQNNEHIVFRHLNGMGKVDLNNNSFAFENNYLSYLGNSSTYSLEMTDDILWIGTTRGLFRVEQSQLYEINPTPLLIDSVTANSERLFKGHLIDSQTLPTLQLAENEREFNVNTVSANYLPHSTTSNRAVLNDSQGSWSESNQTTINVPGAGEHQLTLTQQYNESITPFSVTIRLSVTPFWYETWLVRIAFASAFLLVLIFGLKSYTQRKLQRVEREKQELETIVEQRTATIQKQSGELLALEQSRNKLLSNVSHEFRTPLSLILSPIELVIDKANLGEKFHNHLITAKSNANRLLNLVNQILDINRIENADLPLNREVQDFSTFLEQLLDNFSALSEREHKVIDRNDIEQNILWEFDPYYMERIVFNLLANAFKFTKEGGRITVALKQKKSMIRLTIKDDGIGMREEEREQVFERFFQAEHQTTEFKPGTGIGLSLVKELVERHFGEIRCKSELSVGTEFELRFDYQEPSSNIVLQKQAQTHLTVDLNNNKALEVVGHEALAQEGERQILMVVEDNDELRTFIANLFSSDFHVIKASNGKEGLELAQSRLPDIIISDIMMPLMDGFQLVDALNTDPELNFIPTILLTAKTNKIDTVKGLNKGADDYISKPFHNEELIARVNALLRSQEKLKDRLLKQWANKSNSSSYESEYLNTLKRRLNLELNVQHEDFQLFVTTLEIIRQHLPEEYLTVTYLSERLNMDRSTLLRKLKNILSLSPKQLIREIRLLESSFLLDDKQGSVSEVAYAVGFNCLSYFSKCFKARFGTTPTEYINQI